MTDIFTQKKRSEIMSSVKTKGTDIEKKLHKIIKPIWKTEHYTRNAKNLPGKPDIVFVRSKIAIFADGNFWHGKDFEKWKNDIPVFWKNKIISNINRDVR